MRPIIDDLLATGGTVDCVSKILKSKNKEVVGLLVVVELMKLEGIFNSEVRILSIGVSSKRFNLIKLFLL